MEFYFNEELFENSNIVIQIGEFWTIDQLCASVLAKIFLSLKCKTKVFINSTSFQGSDIFLVNNCDVSDNDWIISFDNNQIQVKNKKETKCFLVEQEIISLYFYNLIVKYNYVIDYEIVGFYTLVALKTSLYLEDEKQKQQNYLKLLKIMNEEQFYTLEYNVDQLIEKVDNFVI